MIRIDIKTTLTKYFLHRYKVRIQVKCHNKNITLLRRKIAKSYLMPILLTEIRT